MDFNEDNSLPSSQQNKKHAGGVSTDFGESGGGEFETARLAINSLYSLSFVSIVAGNFLIFLLPSLFLDGSESADEAKKTDNEDTSNSEASEKEYQSDNDSDSESELRDGEAIGLAALVGADIIDEEESASDFEPSDGDPSDSDSDSNSDDSEDNESSNGDEVLPEKERTCADGINNEDEDEDEEEEVEVEEDNSGSDSSSEEDNSHPNCSEEESSVSSNEKESGKRNRKRKLGDMRDSRDADNDSKESSESGA